MAEATVTIGDWGPQELGGVPYGVKAVHYVIDGIDPRRLPERDHRWLEHRASCVTSYPRKVIVKEILSEVEGRIS